MHWMVLKTSLIDWFTFLHNFFIIYFILLYFLNSEFSQCVRFYDLPIEILVNRNGFLFFKAQDAIEFNIAMIGSVDQAKGKIIITKSYGRKRIMKNDVVLDIKPYLPEYDRPESLWDLK